MFGHKFYHQAIRKYIILFGTIFNDIHMKSMLVMETGDPPLPIQIETGHRIMLDGFTELDQDDVTDSENTFFETGADNFIDFSDADPFSEGGNF